METLAAICALASILVFFVVGYYSGYWLGITAAVAGCTYFYINWHLVIAEGEGPTLYGFSFLLFCSFCLGLFTRFSTDWSYRRKFRGVA